MFSSLKIYLKDLWKRCFGKEYVVKAEGNSEATHDFRKCPKCGKHIPSLNPKMEETKCWCKAILYKNGEYIDFKDRHFKLNKPLRSKLWGVFGLFTILDTLLIIGTFRIRQVDQNSYYSLNYFWINLAIIAFLFIPFLNWLIETKVFGWLKELFFLAGCFLLAITFLFSIIPIMNFQLVSVFDKVLTLEELYAEQLSELEKMPPSIERLNFALRIPTNPKVDFRDEVINFARIDIAKLMNEKRHYVEKFEMNSPRERMLYEIYADYLDSLEPEELKEHCEKDPWYLMSYRTINRYSNTWKKCQECTE